MPVAAAFRTALIGRLDDAPAPDSVACAIAGRVRAKGGVVTTRSLADEIGLSERKLLRRCTSEFGFGPKTLTRIVRMQTVLARLRRHPNAPLAKLAIEFGYADQAHFTHDIRELTGLTPGSLRSAMAPVSEIHKTVHKRRPTIAV